MGDTTAHLEVCWYRTGEGSDPERYERRASSAERYISLLCAVLHSCEFVRLNEILQCSGHLGARSTCEPFPFQMVQEMPYSLAIDVAFSRLANRSVLVLNTCQAVTILSVLAALPCFPNTSMRVTTKEATLPSHE